MHLLFFQQLFYQPDKMSTLYQDQTSKAERYRKHQLYKNMLDEQIRYKNEYKDSNVSYQTITTPKHYTVSQVKYIHQPINPKTPYRQPYAKETFNPPIQRFHTSPEEQNQKYLSSCEEIIRNLRELKQKRKERQLTLRRIENERKLLLQTKQQPRPYQHTRNSYFSSSVKRSKDSLSQIQTPKSKASTLKPLKSIEVESRSTPKETESNKKNLRTTPNNKKLKKIQFNEKIMETDEEKYKDVEYDQPQGIVITSTRNKASMKKLSPRAKKQREGSQPQKLYKSILKNQNAEVKQQHNRLSVQKKEAYDFLIELMKYFKNKNEKSEQEKKKAELINEQTQVDLKEENDKSSQQPTEPQSRKSQMKLKALIKLRQLNQKGREFVAKMKGGKEEEPNIIISKSAERPQSPSQNSKKQEKEHSEILTSPTIQHREETERQKQRFSSIESKISKEEKETQQLFKAIGSKLNRQEMQNQSLTSCLKQLSQYLKDQNEQLQAMKYSKPVMIQPKQRLKSPKKETSRSKSKTSTNKDKAVSFRSEQFPKPKQSLSTIKQAQKAQKKHQKILKQKSQPSKQEESVLKQAFLKRLKKVRLKGKLLNQKIEAYKKQHSPSTTDKQIDKLQVNPQLDPESPGQGQAKEQQKKEEVVNGNSSK